METITYRQCLHRVSTAVKSKTGVSVGGYGSLLSTLVIGTAAHPAHYWLRSESTGKTTSQGIPLPCQILVSTVLSGVSNETVPHSTSSLSSINIERQHSRRYTGDLASTSIDSSTPYISTSDDSLQPETFDYQCLSWDPEPRLAVANGTEKQLVRERYSLKSALAINDLQRSSARDEPQHIQSKDVLRCYNGTSAYRTRSPN